jgi:hypothetical protein
MPGALEDEGHPIAQTPAWIRDLMTPAGELTAMRRLALRYLAGDSVPVRPIAELEELFEPLDKAEDIG